MKTKHKKSQLDNNETCTNMLNMCKNNNKTNVKTRETLLKEYTKHKTNVENKQANANN